MKILWIPPLVLPLILSCAFASPASAGGGEKKVLFRSSEGKGDAGWIEMDRSAGRMRATPYLRISGETVRRAEGAADEAGEVGATASAETGNPGSNADADGMTRGTEALPSLPEDREGVSLRAVLDRARRTSKSARDAVRRFQARKPSSPPPAEAR